MSEHLYHHDPGVHERLRALEEYAEAERERANAAEAKIAAVEKLAASAPFSTPVVSVADLRAALGGDAS